MHSRMMQRAKGRPAWLSPQNMIAGWLALLSVGLYLNIGLEPPLPYTAPPSLEAQASTNQPIGEARQVTIVRLRDGVPEVSFHQLETTPAQAVTDTLALLRQLSPQLWPATLQLAQVYSSPLLSGSPRPILNFRMQTRPALSIAQEQDLYQSIVMTLVRNGYPEPFILVNDAPSPVFIEAIALPSYLR